MDNEYLKRTVGKALAQGMAEVVARQPGDAIDYLGNFLVKFANTREAEAQAALAAAAAEKEAAVQRDLLTKRKAIADAAAAETAALKTRADNFLASLDTVKDVDAGVFSTALSVIKESTNSRAVYIGERVTLEETVTNEEGEETQLQALKYIAATEGSEFMLDELLPMNKGVTFEALKEPEPAEDEEEEDPDGDLDEERPAKEAPKAGLLISNTLADSRMHYFTFAKLGSYFAVPIKYQSYLHENSVTEETLTKFTDHQEALKAAEEARLAKEQAEAEAAEAAEKAAAEKAAAAAAAAEAAANGEGDGNEGENGEENVDEANVNGDDGNAEGDGDDAEEAEPEPEPEPIPDPEYERVTIERVVCMDTLGMGLDIYTEEGLDLVRSIAASIVAALERTERAHLEAEFRALLLSKEENIKDLENLAETQQQQAEELEAQVAELKAKFSEGEEEISEEDQQYEILRLQEDAARRALLAIQAKVKELERYKIAPKGDSMRALKAACYTVGINRKVIVDKATKKLDWMKMRRLFGGEFFKKLHSFDPIKKRKVQKYQTVASIEASLEGLTVEDMNAKSVAVGTILAWNQAVIIVRKAAVEKRQREKLQAEAKAAEEAAAAAAKAKEEADAAAAKAAEEEAAAAAAAAEAKAASDAAEGQDGEDANEDSIANDGAGTASNE
jgi:hypothetical protein